METGSQAPLLLSSVWPWNERSTSWSVTRQYVVSGATEYSGMQHFMLNRHWWIMLKDGLTTLCSNAVNYLLCSHSASFIIHKHMVISPLVHWCCCLWLFHKQYNSLWLPYTTMLDKAWKPSRIRENGAFSACSARAAMCGVQQWV